MIFGVFLKYWEIWVLFHSCTVYSRYSVLERTSTVGILLYNFHCLNVIDSLKGDWLEILCEFSLQADLAGGLTGGEMVSGTEC